MRVQPDTGSASDERLLKRYAPASTGWLILSIIFANKLWVLDATLMSLYWVARLPIGRPLLAPIASPRAELSVAVPIAAARHRRQRKLALSLAIVGALMAPFASGFYKARPTYSVWIPLTAEQKANLAAYLQNSNDCRFRHKPPLTESEAVREFMCEKDKERFEQGGEQEYHSDDLKYFLLNVAVAVATLAGVFSLVFLIPMLFRGFAVLIGGYWRWLNT